MKIKKPLIITKDPTGNYQHRPHFHGSISHASTQEVIPPISVLGIPVVTDTNSRISGGTGSGSLFLLGTEPITYSATDADANLSHSSFNVSILKNGFPWRLFNR